MAENDNSVKKKQSRIKRLKWLEWFKRASLGVRIFNWRNSEYRGSEMRECILTSKSSKELTLKIGIREKSAIKQSEKKVDRDNLFSKIWKQGTAHNLDAW